MARSRPSVDWLIKHLQLQPHPLGGYFRQTYISSGKIVKSALPPMYGGDRHYCTQILSLLSRGEVSRWHKIVSDEMLHFYLGDPISILEIGAEGSKETLLGQQIEQGQRLQHLVPGGNWFGACLASDSEYALVGATVSPAFDFKDLEESDEKGLVSQFPDQVEMIKRLF